MFDRPTSSTGSEPSRIADRDSADLDDILARFDARMRDPEAVTPAEREELAALAGIFDVRADRPISQLWPEVRVILTVQSPRVAPAANLTPPLTLMVVEDDPGTARDLTALLVEAGHDVIGPFHSGEAATVAASLHAVDIALLDINLSGPLDGGALARELKTRWGLKVVFLSGDVSAAASHADIAEAMVIKPYRAADVLAALDRVSVGASPVDPSHR